MSDRVAHRPVFIAAGLLIVLGLILTVRGLSQVPGQLRRVRAKADTLARLHEAAREQAVPDALLGALAGEGALQPPPLDTLLRETLGGAAYELEQGDPQPLRDGWSVQTARVTLEDIPLAQEAGAVAQLEGGRPPWRVTEYTIIPGPVAGRGRVTLDLEALSRRQPAPLP
jgi:hypothetical protein